jgi:Fe2+ transport system protein FeoA
MVFVQGIFCFLLVLSLWLWCRSRDRLCFACFIVMVTCRSRDLLLKTKDPLNEHHNYKDKTNKQQKILERHHNNQDKTAKNKDPLNDTIIIKVKQTNNKSSLERHHNYQDKTNKQQKILERHHNNQDKTAKNKTPLNDTITIKIKQTNKEIVYVLLVLPLWLRVVQRIFCCLFVLSLSLWCRSRDLLLFVCFIFIVMVSFKGALFFAVLS